MASMGYKYMCAWFSQFYCTLALVIYALVGTAIESGVSLEVESPCYNASQVPFLRTIS